MQEEDKEILEMLNKHPALKECVLDMIMFAMADDDITDLDVAEDEVVEKIRKTGSELLECWAQAKSDKATLEVLCDKETRRHEKKR